MIAYLHSMDCTDWLIVSAGVMICAWLVYLSYEFRRRVP